MRTEDRTIVDSDQVVSEVVLIRHISLPTAFRTGLIAAVIWGLIVVVAMLMIYLGLAWAGVVDSLSSSVGQVLGIDFSITAAPVLWVVLGVFATTVVLGTVLSVLSALVFNLSASLSRGVEVTARLKEIDIR